MVVVVVVQRQGPGRMKGQRQGQRWTWGLRTILECRTHEGGAWIWKESEGMNGGWRVMMMTTTAAAAAAAALVAVVWGARPQRQAEGTALLAERGTPWARGDWHLLRPTLRRRLGHADHAGCMGGSQVRFRESVAIHLKPCVSACRKDRLE